MSIEEDVSGFSSLSFLCCPGALPCFESVREENTCEKTICGRSSRLSTFSFISFLLLPVFQGLPLGKNSLESVQTWNEGHLATLRQGGLQMRHRELASGAWTDSLSLTKGMRVVAGGLKVVVMDRWEPLWAFEHGSDVRK